jgi:hypothetical protein
MRFRLWKSSVFWASLLYGSPVWAVPTVVISGSESHPNEGDSPPVSEEINNQASILPSAVSNPEVLPIPNQFGSVSTQARDLLQPPIPDSSTNDRAQKLSEPTSPEPDPELGTFELRDELQLEQEAPQLPETPATIEQPEETPNSPSTTDPELGDLKVQSADDEIGDVPVRPLPPPAPPRPRVKPPKYVYLQGRLDYFRTSNVFSGIDPIDDSLFRSGLSLLATPRIGQQTFLIAGVDANLVHYANEVRINYDELRFRAGIFQQLSPRMYGEIGWTNQQLFLGSDNLADAFSGQRFLNDHAIRVELSRQDPLGKNLVLTTFYQFRLSFAEPGDRSRLINSFFASLGYNIMPALQLGLDYQFALADFTQEDREDRYHQLLMRLSYRLSNQTRLTVFGGYSFGGSSVPTIDFDGGIFGVSFTVNLPLF